MGLHRTDWNEPKKEVGYWLRSSEVGIGYESEGIEVLADWALTDLKAIRVELVTLEENAASRAVAVRCSFDLEGLLRNVFCGPDGNLRHRYDFAKLPSQAESGVQPLMPL